MTALIKAVAIGARLLDPAFATARSEGVTDPGAWPEADPRDEEIERLSQVLRERDETIALHEKALREAREQGKQEGRAACEAEYVADRNAALAKLEAGIVAAQEALRDALGQSGALALLVGRQALEKLVHATEERQRLVADLIDRQLSRIADASELVIEVSRTDFPDTREVEQLAARLEIGSEQIKSSLGLDEGQCRMHWRLGTFEVGPRQQWGAIRDILDEYLADPGVAAS